MLSDTDCEAEKPPSHKRDLMFTPVEVYIEHPLLLVVLLLYGDLMLYGGALQPQRVGSAVQYRHHLITRTEQLVQAVMLVEQVSLYDGGGG